MKCLGKFTILGAVFAASTTLAYASPIQLGSYSTTGSKLREMPTLLFLLWE